MSQLINFSVHSEVENQHLHRNTKQFGASELSRSSTKKTALTDVKNILTQRTKQSGKNQLNSAKKPDILKKNISEKDCKTDCNPKDCNDIDEDAGFVEPPCSFCDKTEDDSADIMLQDLIKLTKQQIDNLALNWERPPLVTEEDMIIEELPPLPDFGMKPIPPLFWLKNSDSDDYESLINELPMPQTLSDIEESFSDSWESIDSENEMTPKAL